MTNLKMSTIHNGHYHPLYHAGRAVRPDGYFAAVAAGELDEAVENMVETILNKVRD